MNVYYCLCFITIIIVHTLIVVSSRDAHKLQESIEKEKKFYQEWTERAGWFFFQLLATGYVEDTESGESFQLPVGLGWKIYIEV